MGIYDLFGESVGGAYPSIGGIQSDFTNLSNLASGKAKSADYGGGVGAGVGSFFGAPQQGADIGRTVFPILNQTVRPFLSNLWNDLIK